MCWTGEKRIPRRAWADLIEAGRGALSANSGNGALQCDAGDGCVVVCGQSRDGRWPLRQAEKRDRGWIGIAGYLPSLK